MKGEESELRLNGKCYDIVLVIHILIINRLFRERERENKNQEQNLHCFASLSTFEN